MKIDPQFSARKLREDFALTPVMSTEIEFYLKGVEASGLQQEQVIEKILSVMVQEDLPVAQVNAETGKDQYEMSLLPTKDIGILAANTERFKTAMLHAFSEHNIRADFSAKPDEKEPGSGLHIHLHLENKEDRNIFTRAGREMADPFSDQLLDVLGGMLFLMNPSMMVFVPEEKSYARFVPKSNAPMTVSWGTNNRTVALRLPTKALDNKHIEHRVAGSDADTASVIGVILAGAHYGLKHKPAPGEPVYGDAALPQYKLAPLAKTMQEAEIHAKNCAALKDYLA